MSLFDSLLIAHFLGDWLFQTEWQALHKRTHWGAMWSHVAVYHAVVLAVLLLQLPARTLEIFAAVGILALSHAWIDREWPIVRLMKALRIVRVRAPERWLVVIVDQIVHVTLLAIAAEVLSRAGP
ncbi:MAG: hypothetical protein A2Z17_05120 [Gammaproteobacteria bacterium RBG_16_66_13]|nr:MAG: hypothetical protein A2Z17_05120 [Gammaproteobacteria bacterium RBG_16_66_13]